MSMVSSHTADSKPVKREVNGTVILPPLVFPGFFVNLVPKKGVGRVLKKVARMVCHFFRRCQSLSAPFSVQFFGGFSAGDAQRPGACPPALSSLSHV